MSHERLVNKIKNAEEGSFINPYPKTRGKKKKDKWYVFNKEGNGQSIIETIILQIPAVSLPIKDIKSMNRSLAILSNDHISILNVKLK